MENNELDFTKDSEIEKFSIKESGDEIRIKNATGKTKLNSFQQKVLIFVLNVLTEQLTFAQRLKIGISSCFFFLFIIVGVYKCVSFIVNLL